MLDVSVHVTGDSPRLEIVECLSIVYSLVQNRLPRQFRLGTFQYEKLEQCIVVVDRDAPFLVMILDHQWIVAECCPITSPNLSLLQFPPSLVSLQDMFFTSHKS